MISLADYAGREQSYIKHIFLSSYFERLVFKTASKYDSIAYIDGFAGPWQSAKEKYEDTSFGIALAALRRAKSALLDKGRVVNISAFLVERDKAAYAQLQCTALQFPDLSIHSYNADFMSVAGNVLTALGPNTFAFFFIDPKGWKIRIKDLTDLLARPHSEVVFTFMFDFINRAASMRDPVIANALDELMPFGDWRSHLARVDSRLDPERAANQRKLILVSAFRETLSRLGNYPFVAETPIRRPLADRPLYCLFYGTRHSTGVEVFRDCQVKALKQQSRVRAARRLQHQQAGSGQGEMFGSLLEMAPDEAKEILADERRLASETLLALAPRSPNFKQYNELLMMVLTKYIVTKSDVNKIAADLKKEGRLAFPDWEPRKRVPDAHYRVQRIR